MAWERGAWEKRTSMGGYVSSYLTTSNKTKPAGSRTVKKTTKKQQKRENLINCPICNAEQSYLREKCIKCGYEFTHNRKDKVELHVYEFENKGFDIPSNKKNDYYRNTYFKRPYLVSNKNEVFKKSVELINSNSNGNVLFICDDDEINEKIQKKFNKLSISAVINKKDFENTLLKKLIDNIKEFRRINNDLSRVYTLKKFNNLESAECLSDLNVINENVHYINDKDGMLLNEFIKLYGEYNELLQSNDLDFDIANQDIEDNVPEIARNLLSRKQSIIWIKSSVEKLEKIFDSLGISSMDLEEKIDFIDSLDILKSKPSLIDSKRADEFIKTLKEYKKRNTFNKLSSDYKNKNKIIDAAIYCYQKYLDNKSEYQDINNQINDLKDKFDEFGFELDNLDNFNELKNNQTRFSNAFYIDNDDYDLLNTQLKEFLRNNNDSIYSVFKRCRRAVAERYTKSMGEYKIDLPDGMDVKSLSKFIHLLSQLGVNVNSLKSYDENEKNIWLLSKNPSLIGDDDSNKGFIDKVNQKANGNSIAEYVDLLFEDLKEIVYKLFSDINDDYMDDFRQEYINYNIEVINDISQKMGIQFNSFTSLENFIDELYVLGTESVWVDPHQSSNFEKIYERGIVSDKTVEYVLDNSIQRINGDLKKLANHVESLRFEVDNEKDYGKRVSLLNLSKKNTFGYQYTREAIFQLFKESTTFESKITNYKSIFELLFLFISAISFEKYDNELLTLRDDFDLVSKILDGSDSDVISNSQNYFSSLKEQHEINAEFTKLFNEGFFNEDSLELANNRGTISILHHLDELSVIIRHCLEENGLYDVDFKEIQSQYIKKEEDIRNKEMNMKKLLKDFNSSDIDNIYENYLKLITDCPACENVEIYDDLKLISKISELYSHLNLPVDDFYNLSSSHLKKLTVYLDDCHEFTDCVDNGIFTKDAFKDSDEKISYLEFEITEIKYKLKDLGLDESIVDDFSNVDLGEFSQIEQKLQKIKESYGLQQKDIYSSIENQYLTADLLVNLCNDHFIEIDEEKYQFNSTNIKDKLMRLQSDLCKFKEIVKLENDVLNYDDIIGKNLKGIWKSPLGDIEEIKSKLDMDKKFTELYNKNKFSDLTIENMEQMTPENFEFLENFKNAMSKPEARKEYLLLLNNNEVLLDEIQKLNMLSSEELSDYYPIFNKINDVLNNEEITQCLNYLEIQFKKDNSMDLLNEYKEKLKEYTLLYYKYFDRNHFDIPMEDLIKRLDMHLKYTQLIDDGIFQKERIFDLNSKKDIFFKQVEKLNALKDNMSKQLEKCKSAYEHNDFIDVFECKTPFSEIESLCERMKNKNIHIMNSDLIDESLNFKYENHFDNVVCFDDGISERRKLNLYLISKNKLLIVKLGGK